MKGRLEGSKAERASYSQKRDSQHKTISHLEEQLRLERSKGD